MGMSTKFEVNWKMSSLLLILKRPYLVLLTLF